MRKIVLFGLLLCIGVATASGQKSNVHVFGIPLGSTYEEFLSAFTDKSFTGNILTNESNDGVVIYNINGTFMTYKCAIKMYATKLTHTVYKIEISFPFHGTYKDIPGEQQCCAVISLFEDKYGKATLVQKMHGSKVVQNIEDSSAALWHLSDNIELEMFYRGFDNCKITYGGKEALNGLCQKEWDQYNEQKALENQNQLSGSNL